MNSKIETNWYLPITADLSKQRNSNKQRHPNSYKEFSPKCLFKSREQSAK